MREASELILEISEKFPRLMGILLGVIAHPFISALARW